MPIWRSLLRQFAAAGFNADYRRLPVCSLTAGRLFHTSAGVVQKPLFIAQAIAGCSKFTPLTNSAYSCRLHPSPFPLIQVRHLTLKQRKRKLKSRKPTTPVISKVKKIKIKCYSSFKDRFRIMHDGQIRRWKEGKRHNAHSKSKKSKRRLRQPGIVPLAYAKVMKKLNFCG